MSKWREACLDEMTDIILSNVDKKINTSEKQVLLCNYLDVYQNRYLSGKHSFSSGAVNNREWARFHLLENDVVITKDSEEADDIAVPSVISESIDKLVCGYHLAILRSKGEIDGQFLMSLLQLDKIKRQFSNNANGITRYGLTINAIESIKLNFPVSLSAQRKIARILSTVDSVVEETEAAIAKYKAIKQGMMQDLFTRGLDKNGKLRPRYQDVPELYQKTELGWIPKDWNVKSLDCLCEIITDGSHFSPAPQVDGSLIVNVKDLTEWGISFDTCTRISQEDFSMLERNNCMPNYNDVLLSKDGTIGRVILFESKRRVVLLSSIAMLRANSSLEPSFLKYALQTDSFNRQIWQLQSGSALKRIVLRDINKLAISYPDKLIQIAMAKILSCIDNMIQKEEVRSDKFRSIKLGLMSVLLTGQVPVKCEEGKSGVNNASKN